MLHKIRDTLSPAAYHGQKAKPPYFEGWYYKLVSRDGRRALAVIPGIYLGNEPAASHSFVMLLDAKDYTVDYHRFPTNVFQSKKYEFDIAVNGNRFGDSGLSLVLEGPAVSVSGSLNFINPVPWPVSLKSPGIMGWYAWAPFMQCYHGVVSLDHRIEGFLQINGESVNFSGGRGYIEKDWGKSFPSCWIWMQCNHFAAEGTSFTGSMAIIPWIRGSFPGFIVGVWHEKRLYRFATYTGAKTVKADLSKTSIGWILQDKKYRLEIYAKRRLVGGVLHAPTSRGMDRKILETLDAEVRIRLSEIAGGSVIFEGSGAHAGMEVVGDINPALCFEISK